MPNPDPGSVWWDDDTYGGYGAWFVMCCDGGTKSFDDEDHALAVAEVERRRFEG